jgi:hypothetical protein
MLATEETEKKEASRTAQARHAPRRNRVNRDQPVGKDSFLSAVPAGRVRKFTVDARNQSAGRLASVVDSVIHTSAISTTERARPLVV